MKRPIRRYWQGPRSGAALAKLRRDPRIAQIVRPATGREVTEFRRGALGAVVYEMRQVRAVEAVHRSGGLRSRVRFGRNRFRSRRPRPGGGHRHWRAGNAAGG